MSVSIVFKTKGKESVLKRISQIQENLKTQTKAYIQAVTNDADTTLTESLKNRVYGRAASPNYRRTGSAGRGRKVEIQGDKGKVTMASTLGGAARNYTPFLNRNRRVRKNNTLFWDDGLIAVKNDFSRRNKILAKKIIGG